MKHLFKPFTFLLLPIFLFTSLAINAQSFPESWKGKWAGDLEIWEFNEKKNTFPMSLEILPKDTAWTFTISYLWDPDNPDIRRYSLVTIQDNIGHYAIDEHNSIILDSYLNGNCFYTSFGGLGSELLTRICKKGDELEYEINSAKSDPIRVSGDTVIGQDTIPAIKSYSVFHLMKAVLEKVE